MSSWVAIPETALPPFGMVLFPEPVLFSLEVDLLNYNRLRERKHWLDLIMTYIS